MDFATDRCKYMHTQMQIPDTDRRNTRILDATGILNAKYRIDFAALHGEVGPLLPRRLG